MQEPLRAEPMHVAIVSLTGLYAIDDFPQIFALDGICEHILVYKYCSRNFPVKRPAEIIDRH